MANVGYATLTVIPSATNFATALGSQVNAPLASAGKSGGLAAGGAFKSAFAGLAGMYTALIGSQAVQAVGNFVKGSIDAASELQQAMGGVDAVFGESAGKIKKWGETAANTVRLSEADYAMFATRLGGQLKKANMPLDEVAERTNRLMELAADLASRYGYTVPEALEAMGSAFRGEFDPIEKFNVNLKASEVNAYAVAKGYAANEKSVDDAARAMATYDLLLEESADAHGAAAEEADTYASNMEELKAKWENFKADIGEKFLPAAATALEGLQGLMDGADNLTGSLERLSDGYTTAEESAKQCLADAEQQKDGWAGVGQSMADTGSKMGSAFDGAKESLSKVWDSMGGWDPIVNQVTTITENITTSFGMFATGIGDIIGGLCDTVRGLIEGDWNLVWDGAGRTLGGFGNLVGSTFALVGGIILGFFGVDLAQAQTWWNETWAGIQTFFQDVWNNICNYFSERWSTWQQGWNEGINGLSTTWNTMWTNVSTFFHDTWNNVCNFFSERWAYWQQGWNEGLNGLSTTWNTIWTNIQSFFAGAWNGVVTFFQTQWTNFQTSWSTGLTNLSTWWNTSWTNIQMFFSNLWNNVVTFFQTLWTNFQTSWSTGLTNVGTWWNTTWTNIQTFFMSIWNNLIGSLFGFLNTLQTNMQNAINNIRIGWDRGWNAVRNFVADAWNNAMESTRRGVENVCNFVRNLPENIRQAIGNLGQTLWSSGESLMNGFVEGIKDTVGNVGDAIHSGLSWVRDLFPHSPAKRGPFSGHGYTTYSGRALMDGFAEGIRRTTPVAVRAAEAAAEAIHDALLVETPTITAPSIEAGGLMGAVQATAGQATPLVGSLTMQSTGDTRDDLDETLFQLRRIQRGGVHA